MPEGQVDTGRTTHLPLMHRDVPWKYPVRVATTANGTMASAFDNGSTVDGVTLATDDRILIKNQTATEENGIYVVQASGVPFRTYDMDDPEEVPGAVVFVMAGTANAGTFWTTVSTPAVLDDDAIVFSAFSAGSGAPTTADYLVGTSQAGLSAEIVVGTTPNGELGGTWGAITVDGTHSGSAHTDFIAKSLLTTQDDIIVRDASAPARLAKGSDGQVLTVDPTTHHLVWATPTSGGISGIGVKEAGSTVVASATALDFLNSGFDVTSPGGGVAAVAFDPSEIALDTLGATTDITTLNSTTSAHGLLRKLDASVVNFLRGDGAWADPSIAPSSALSGAYFGDGSDGDVTISVDTNLTKDMFYHNLTVNSGITLSTLLLRVFVSGTLTLTGTIACDGNNATAGGTGTGAAGGAAGGAGAQQTGGAVQSLPSGAAGRAGTVGGFNSNGLSNGGNASQSSFALINVPAGSTGGISGSGRNGGTGGSASTGSITEGARPYYWPRITEWRNLTGTGYNMNTVCGQQPAPDQVAERRQAAAGVVVGLAAPAGHIVVCARAITGAGTIRAKGGNGGNGGNGLAAAQAGGGAGGNGGQGGVAVLVYRDNTGWTGTLDVSGGTKGTGGSAGGGAGSANGGNGSDGTAGLSFSIPV